MLQLSPLYRIDQGFNKWDAKIYQFWQFYMQFTVLIEFFFGFSFLDDLFYDFAVSNRPQCSPFVSQLFPLGLISMQVELGWVQFLVEKNFYIPFKKFL